MTFKEAVEVNADIAANYRIGLGAIEGKHRQKIIMADSRKCEGSVDIDKSLAVKYSNANRWDYSLSYNGEVFFLEVHGAQSSDVKTMINKLQWLKTWLTNEAPELNELKATSKSPYCWVSTKGIDIPSTSKQYREMIQAGIVPKSILKLP